MSWIAQNDIFHERRHTRSFLQSFKWFKAILTSTIFHIRLPHKPNHGLGLRQGWNSENLQKWIWLAKNDFFHEIRHTRSFLQSFKWFKSHFDKLPYFTPDFPTNQIMDWDLDKSEILKTYKNEFEWLKTIFFMKKGIRDHFCTVSSDLKPFWQVTIFYTRLRHKPNHGLGLRQGWNSETYKNEFEWLKRIFSWKKAYAIILQSFKWFKAILTSYIFHTRLPHKPNYGLGLRTRVKFWKLTKMSLNSSKRYFSMKEGIRDHFAKFQVI